MNRSSSQIFILSFLAVLLLSGCSLFQTSSGKTQDPAFYSSATSMQNPDVVPAEIAMDIKEVMKGGKPRSSSADSKIKSEPTKGAEAVTETQPNENAAAGTQTDAEQPKPELKSPIANSANGKHRRPAKGPGGVDKYKVKKGDTLMKISFEKYGNVYRWREIYNSNKNLIADFNRLKAGTILTIAGIEYVVILRNGKPYLIRRNDTLVKISSTLYGTPAGWKGLWANNPQLIHDPNKIYAGFTMYYLPIDELPKEIPKLSYSNRRQLDKLKSIESLRKPATTK